MEWIEVLRAVLVIVLIRLLLDSREGFAEGSASVFEGRDDKVTLGGSIPQPSAAEWCAGGGPLTGNEDFDFEQAGSHVAWREVMKEPLGGHMIRHEITVRELVELLSELDDDLVLSPNAVGNLRILKNEQYVGYIDLGFAKQVVMNTPSKPPQVFR